MKSDEKITGSIQEFMGFSEEEARAFMDSQRNRDVMSKFGTLMNTRLVFTVVEAKGCSCRHRPGQAITIRGDGMLLSEGGESVCAYLVQAMIPAVYGAQEFIYAGLDPQKLKFRRAGCFDVGLSCGGIGHVVVELNVH